MAKPYEFEDVYVPAITTPLTLYNMKYSSSFQEAGMLLTL